MPACYTPQVLGIFRILAQCCCVHLYVKSANGTLILILGILGFAGFGCLTGVPAWVMGHNAEKEINAGIADPSERGLVVAGKILGMITTILTLLGICIFIAMFAGLFGLAAAGAASGAK